MKIVFPFPIKIPVSDYGGIERMAYWHMVELAKQGHQPVLIGSSDSSVTDKGIQHIHWKKDEDWRPLIPKDTDIVHLFSSNNWNIDFPVINTISGNGQPGEVFTENSVFVSLKHAQNHDSKCYVHNGIDLNEYPFEDHKINWDSFLFLAKGTWRVKNLKHCLKAVKKSNKVLHIAGGRSFWPSKKINSYGIVGGAKKLEIMKKCDALLFPVRWHEPFGIAIIEAMAMGLPVVGSCFGSLPEIITPETGFLCKNYQEFQEIVALTSVSFKAKDLRAYVESKFTIEHHTRAYVKLYEQIKDGEDLNPHVPKYLGHKRAEDRLEF